MDKFVDAAVAVGALIIGVASLSVILSPKARTASVIQAAASGFSNSLATATAPVTGASVAINTSYPGIGFGGLNL